MIKKTLLAALAVFVAWSVMDFVIHGIFLSGTYEETKDLWRPMEEMKHVVIYVVGVLAALIFVYIYARLITEKSLKNATIYGLLIGLMTGVSMGYGTYSFMPIPYHLAFSWFLASTIEMTVGGVLIGLIVKPETAS